MRKLLLLLLTCCLTLYTKGTTTDSTAESTESFLLNATDSNTTYFEDGSTENGTSTPSILVVSTEEGNTPGQEMSTEGMQETTVPPTPQPTKKAGEKDSKNEAVEEEDKGSSKLIMGFAAGIGGFIGLGTLLCVAWRVACGLGFKDSTSTGKVAPMDFRSKNMARKERDDSTSSRRQLNEGETGDFRE